MTVFIPESCWKSCKPHPTMRALLTGGVLNIFINTFEPEGKKQEIS
jgi:hypothetical protein